MKKLHTEIDYKEVTRRIEKEMEGYSPSSWAAKVGVRINVVSNIHGPSAKQNPSLNYILAVALATRKPMEYFLWGSNYYWSAPKEIGFLGEKLSTYGTPQPSGIDRIPVPPDPAMGRRVRYLREDMGLSLVDVMRRTDLPLDLIKSVEAGYHPTSDVIVKIADALRCSTDFILGCGANAAPQVRRIEKNIRKPMETEDAEGT